MSGNGRAFLTVDGPDGWAIRITDADPVPADPEAVAVSAWLPDGAVHLVAADDSLAEGHRYGVYIGMCGELLAASSLPPSLCPDDCDRDHPYCSDCLREAARKHA